MSTFLGSFILLELFLHNMNYPIQYSLPANCLQQLIIQFKIILSFKIFTTMKSKGSKKLTDIALNAKEVVKADQCANVKGGGYWCCIRNKWIN